MESMERDGYEADKIRLIVMNLKTGEKKNTRKISTKTSEHSLGGMTTSTICISDYHATMKSTG